MISIGAIEESGRVDINVLRLPPDAKTHHSSGWLFGPGVAVQEYFMDGEVPSVRRFDEYDLATGRKLRTRITRPPPSQQLQLATSEMSLSGWANGVMGTSNRSVG